MKKIQNVSKQTQEKLNFQSDTRINFIIQPDSKVYIQPLNIEVEELSGILHKPKRKPVSIDAMNQAVEQYVNNLS
ncbi:AbrB family transcriptional regulator [Brasilonema bromeliae]|uniref:AbrB family transcriptional regulator n=1 Tax=Brasilonema bromeliae SPC951 TaxID=385972 RepID=A0ABX1PFL9_9CYAN|nr:AbrB family transcriptional regulator [Brasilonema bromeliae SPC951]